MTYFSGGIKIISVHSHCDCSLPIGPKSAFLRLLKRGVGFVETALHFSSFFAKELFALAFRWEFARKLGEVDADETLPFIPPVKTFIAPFQKLWILHLEVMLLPKGERKAHSTVFFCRHNLGTSAK